MADYVPELNQEVLYEVVYVDAETLQDSKFKPEDTGLQGGAAFLRDQGLLQDYTLIIEGQTFKVHKFVLASVSEFFRDMICGSMSESTSDTVQLSEVSAEIVSQLLDYIYTGDPCHINNNTKGILELAAFFQMPKIVDKCGQHLLKTLSVGTCVDLVSTFNTYLMEKEAAKVVEYVTGNLTKVIKRYPVSEITPFVMKIIMDNWKKDDWNVFQYVCSWVSLDLENRKDFMSRLNFNLMSSEQIKSIQKMDIYTKSEGDWKHLVEKASAYHQQTILQKVVDCSEQRMTKLGKSAFLFTEDWNGKHEIHVQRVVKNKKNASEWERCNSIASPKETGKISFTLEVNNFLITCSEYGANQTWQVFDPLTLSWTKMPNMPEPKDAFAMVYYNKHLYVLGGCIGSGAQTSLVDTIYEYDFQANSWSATKKLPVPLRNLSACVLNGGIYISGGETAVGASHATNRLDSLNPVTQKWESKAPMHKAMSKHKMCVMTIRRQEALVVIDRDLEVHCYYPSTDQWSSCYFSVNEQFIDKCRDKFDHPYKDVCNLRWHPDTTILVDGNTVYLLNMYGKAYKEIMYAYEETDSPPVMIHTEFLCAKWRFEDEADDDGRKENTPIRITQFGMENFEGYSRNAIGGVLAFSANIQSSWRDF